MSRATDLVLSAEGAWTWVYTAGMHEEASTRRRAEILSAGWEYREWVDRRGTGGVSAGFHAAWQFLAGIPADVAWRCSAGGRFSRRQQDEAAVAALLVLGLLLVLPLGFLALKAGPAIARDDDSAAATIVCAFATVVLLLYGLGSVLCLDRWPAATAALGLIGSLSLVCCFAWWLPELAAAAASAGAFAAVAGTRVHRQQHRG